MFMRAITVNKPGGVKELVIKNFDKPKPRDNEILIKVHATAINRTDIISRERGSGYMGHPILGVEVSGIVEEVGESSNIKVGTRVMGLVNNGGYAEYALMPEDR